MLNTNPNLPSSRKPFYTHYQGEELARFYHSYRNNYFCNHWQPHYNRFEVLWFSLRSKRGKEKVQSKTIHLIPWVSRYLQSKIVFHFIEQALEDFFTLKNQLSHVLDIDKFDPPDYQDQLEVSNLTSLLNEELGLIPKPTLLLRV